MKLHSYRNEEVRFGTKDYQVPVNSGVKTYTLSPEELETYKNKPKREQVKVGKPIKFKAKEPKQTKEVALTKEMYLNLKEQKKSDKAIIKEYGLHSNLLVKLKYQWGIGK